MKLVINTETDTLSLVFTDEHCDEMAVIKPDILLFYTDQGNVGSIEILGLSKHLAGKKAHALELDLAPDHSETHIEVEWPERVQKMIEKVQREAASKPRPDFAKVKFSELGKRDQQR